MQPENKDAVLLPRTINGQWALIHRPVGLTSARGWISYSSDLRNWVNHNKILEAVDKQVVRECNWGFCRATMELAGWNLVESRKYWAKRRFPVMVR